MNKLAKHMHLNPSFYANTHGLMNERSYSTAHDVALITHYAMKNEMFKEVVAKQSYSCRLFNRTYGHHKETLWENTNKLLPVSGFMGVKTGITPAAGPCLSSCFQFKTEEYFIVVVLKTKSCEMRFRDTANLLKEVFRQYLAQHSSSKAYKRALNNLDKYDKL